eukprot:CAMPEP_0117422586 /NCGR_PEP_ID=MMETSP0758-20121206/3396_1 /TAXON_ID=63605 /ORGANISM="Percolomonas cosmopolitus, Strain AE-1 (ATCC 50343)" /LENGTH=131 /DNA_ID=CAMNT_0005205295 /DNA_START=1753 /DNA_END=2148 /DNA_ORIENTATION=+
MSISYEHHPSRNDILKQIQNLFFGSNPMEEIHLKYDYADDYLKRNIRMVECLKPKHQSIGSVLSNFSKNLYKKYFKADTDDFNELNKFLVEVPEDIEENNDEIVNEEESFDEEFIDDEYSNTSGSEDDYSQ